MTRLKVSVTIDLNLLATRLKSRGRRFIRAEELAQELGVTSRSAGRLLSSLAKLGYVSRWSSKVYLINIESS